MLHETIRIALLTLTLGVSAACSSSSKPASAPPPAAHRDEHAGMGMGMDMGSMCPMGVEGTAVAAEDIDGGVALAFTTPKGDVTELRARVHRMAEMHQSGMMHEHGAMDDHEMAKMAESKATVVDIDGGARLELTTADEAAVSDLRAHVRKHAEQMASAGTCPMMDHEGAAQHEHGG